MAKMDCAAPLEEPEGGNTDMPNLKLIEMVLGYLCKDGAVATRTGIHIS